MIKIGEGAKAKEYEIDITKGKYEKVISKIS